MKLILATFATLAAARLNYVKPTSRRDAAHENMEKYLARIMAPGKLADADSIFKEVYGDCEPKPFCEDIAISVIGADSAFGPVGAVVFDKVNGRIGYIFASINNLNGRYGLPETCTDGPLKFHIHDKWNYTLSDDFYAYGPDGCGSDKTGGHYDPTLACGPATGNSLCKSKDLPASSADPDNTAGAYTCSPAAYAKNAYVCEVGDLSGKFGGPVVTDQNPPIPFGGLFLCGLGNSGCIYDLYEEGMPLAYFNQIGANVLEGFGKSVVFHCNDGTRAMCGPIYRPGIFTPGHKSK